MQQLTQQLKSGRVRVTEVPVPLVGAGQVLVRNQFSLISAGTEGATVGAARRGLVGKAKARPAQVKQVVEVVKTQGVVPAYRAVMKKLEAYSPLGYSCAGTVVGVGAGVNEFSVGDLVACAGNSACHAEVVSVPVNLCVRLQDSADLRGAAYNTLGAISLQGVRQADLRLGESCVVVGLGLIGQLTCLLLRAAGVKTYGVDVSTDAVEVAKRHSADDAWCRDAPGLEDLVLQHTGGLGADAVIITAGTDSTDPINLAGQLARKRGRVVVVGAVPTGFDRDPHWYRKELELRMSCSYGPGRYDPNYEEKGNDYPAAYVRWTEKRNMEAFQEMLHGGKIDLDFLTTHQFQLDDAADAYDMILSRSEPFLGILIEYDTDREIDSAPIVSSESSPPSDQVGVSFIGAGSYAQGNLLPNLPNGIARCNVLTQSGTTSKRVADKFGFARSVSRTEDVLHDNATNLVFIATRHDSHAKYTIDALRAGKHVFVEKPLCVTPQELDEIAETLNAGANQLVVGFNRRFSPHAAALKSTFASGPKAITYRVNAGKIPAEHWIQDRDIGGGRIVGEGCHFIDFMSWLCDSVPVRVYARALRDADHHHDTASITIELADGSIGTLHYFANGGTGLSKELIEVHQSGISAVLDDFRVTRRYVGGKPKQHRTRSQDKGQSAMIAAVFNRIREGGEPLIPPAQIFSVIDACFAVERSLLENGSVEVRSF